jgi:hypothetical protein
MIETRAPEMMIPVEESFAAWRKDPKYVAAYTALENEFAGAAVTAHAAADSLQRASAR